MALTFDLHGFSVSLTAAVVHWRCNQIEAARLNHRQTVCPSRLTEEPPQHLGAGLSLPQEGYMPDFGSLFESPEACRCQSTGEAGKQGLETALKIWRSLAQGLRGSLATLLIYPLIFSEKLPTTLLMLKKATEERGKVF